MDDKKKLAERIISGLTNGENLSTVMLRVQVFVSLLDNDNLKRWLKSEQYGYPLDAVVPEYRHIGCGTLKANIMSGGGMWENFTIPTDVLPEHVQSLVSVVQFREAVSTLEAYTAPSPDNKRQMLKVSMPSSIYRYVDEVLDGDWHRTTEAWVIIPSQSVIGMLERIKSTLLDFIIKIKNELELDIDISSVGQEKINKIMNTTIYANAVHTGTGDMNVSNNNMVIGDDAHITISPDSKQQIQELVNQLNSLKSQLNIDEVEFTEYLDEIQKELDSKMPSPKILRQALRAIKGFGGIVTEKAIEFGLDQVIANIIV